MNAGIQGLAADIFKVALVRIDGALQSEGIASRLVLQVHDEVLVEVPEAEREAVGKLTVDTMRHAAELRVPLEVNTAFGRTWADAKT
jgi:DNA polymerase-1